MSVIKSSVEFQWDGAATRRRTLAICLINPKFEPSFWGHDHALPLMHGDKRCWMVTGALPALAGLVPQGHHIELIDENIEEIDFDDLRRFDIIGLTGMIIQDKRMKELLHKLKSMPGVVVVGGPYVSVQPESFAGLCDVRFVGEAEETWPAFINALAEGAPTLELYRQKDRTDMSTVPPARYDLIKSQHYMMASIQFSRGCPFRCEFCDIITVFGRRPRLKTSEQLIRELEGVRRAGFRVCFLVDDNFIGNKVEAKKFLRKLIEWQQQNDYPLQLFTEVSINLADDQELMDLMLEANFLQIFTGVESPRAASLNETLKTQNTRGDGLVDKLRRIRDSGFVITAGFIVGFDNDDAQIFDEQYAFIQEMGIAQAIVGILTPIPSTPLYDRLKAEGRLDFGHPEVAFLPKQMSREELASGHEALMLRLFEPNAFFGRLLHGYKASDSFRKRRAALAATFRRPTLTEAMARRVGGWMMAAKLVRELARHGRLREVGLAYLRSYVGDNLRLGGDAIPFPSFVQLCAIHWHYYNIARQERKTFGIAQPGEFPLAAE
ncbi:B12-binding domain-containing radical SAM protein [Aminobacter sp. HY435]|uniref:B12-binding domain-containing radical SAM protein n=1 Tax=Aminobacter sp. HY435 TaxID=2970917 RepID=UPI0022B94331|nr:radical SAM protein [Aminobacter sp. HY435]